MAELHNQLFREVWTDAIKKALGISKSQGAIERFGETLTPIIDLWAEPDHAFLRRETLWVSRRLAAGNVALEFSAIATENPAGSNQIVTVMGAAVRSTVATEANLLVELNTVIEATLQTTATRPRARDTRVPVPVVTEAQTEVNLLNFFGSDAGAIGIALDNVSTLATGETVEFPSARQGYVLRPGTGIVIVGGTVNTTVVGSFWGKMRAAFPGEL